MKLKKIRITWRESNPRATRHMDGALALNITARSKTQRVYITWKEITTPYHHDPHRSQKAIVHHHHVGAAVEERNHYDHGESMIVVIDNCHL
jgi:hypothetical protein